VEGSLPNMSLFVR